MMYNGLHKEGQKQVYNDATARVVQPVQDTQDIFDVSLLIYSPKKSFAHRYGLLRNKTPL